MRERKRLPPPCVDYIVRTNKHGESVVTHSAIKVGEKGEVLLGPPVVVTPENVDSFAF